jgi:hypothetical protein
MLDYNENSEKTKIIAAHYASRVGEELLVSFMSGQIDVRTHEEAQKVIDGFWKMTDLAIEDNEKDIAVQGISDIEFWMHKLFNKVYGYMVKNGYEGQWKKSLSER